METSISSLVNELNKKDCPKFIVLEEFVILNLNNITEILPDIKKNCKETKDDLFIEILFGEEHEKLHGVRVSQILEAIKKVKEKTNDQAPVQDLRGRSPRPHPLLHGAEGQARSDRHRARGGSRHNSRPARRTIARQENLGPLRSRP